jgi:hypothetical protein
MSKQEGEVREVPFLKNDMKVQPPATGKPLDCSDSPGKADAECGGQKDAVESKGNITINVDDAQLDQTCGNQTTENKR